VLFTVPKSGKTEPQPVPNSNLTAEGWSEKSLENYLRQHLPKLIGEDLWVIAQSRPYEPEVDLLALDREGDLWFSN
jgi:hypothetical protein